MTPLTGLSSVSKRYAYGQSIMRLVVIGVNHKTAPVALRERLALVGADVNTALEQLEQFTDGSIIVSTCNRTEIYALVPQTIPQTVTPATSSNIKNVTPTSASASVAATSKASHTSSASVSPAAVSAHILKIKNWLAEFKQLPLSEVDPYLYVHRDVHALTHWLSCLLYTSPSPRDS